MKAKNKVLSGIFHKLKYSSFLLSFALFNIIGISPSVGLVEKYLLVENYLINDFDFNLIVIFANIVLVSLCVIRIIYPISNKDDNNSEFDYDLARRIDRNIYFIIPALVISLLMFISFVFFGSINNYLKGFLL